MGKWIAKLDDGLLSVLTVPHKALTTEISSSSDGEERAEATENGRHPLCTALPKLPKAPPAWTEAQRLCLRYLDWIGPLDLRNLAAAAQLPPGEALAALRGLRELGHVARTGDAWRVTDRAIQAAGGDDASR